MENGGVPAHGGGTAGLGDLDGDFHRNIVDILFDGVYYVDRRRRITYWNQGAARITGYSRDDVVGRRCFDNTLQHVDGAGNELCRGHCPLVAAMSSRQPTSCHVYLHHREGHRVPVQVRATPIIGANGKVVGAVEIFSESFELEEARTEIDTLGKLAYLDELTQLRNRRAVELALDLRLQQLASSNWPLGVLLIDIDRFKRVNDEHGHDAGDAALRMVAKTLSNGLRGPDLVGRWGGEEFVVLAATDSVAALVKIGERLRMLIEASSIDFEGERLAVTISVGATVASAADTPETLIDAADAMMYESKARGGNCVVATSG